MIKRLKYKEIDFEKYRKCLETCCQNADYAEKNFLDIVADRKWFLLVKGDYEAVMPVAYTCKMGIKIILMPKLCQQLGIFSPQDNPEVNLQFYLYLTKKFHVATYNFNQNNIFPADFNKKTSYVIKSDLYKRIKDNYSVHRRRNIRMIGDLPQKIGFRNNLLESDYDFFSKNIRGTHKEKDNRDYFNLARKLSDNGIGIVRIMTYDEEVQCLVYLFEGMERFYLSLFVNKYPLSNPNLPSIMIDRCLQEFIEVKSFDFMGSDVQTVAKFNERFGAGSYKYVVIFNSKKDLLINFFRN